MLTTSAFGVTNSREIVQRVMDPKKMEVSRSMDTDFLNYLWVYRTSLRLGRALVSTFVFFCKIYGWQSVCGH